MTGHFQHYLTPFLASLRCLARPLTLDDYRRLHRVLSSEGEWTHQRLQQVMAALLTHSEDQQVAFIAEYQAFFPADTADNRFSPVLDIQALRRELALLLDYELDEQIVDELQTPTRFTPSGKDIPVPPVSSRLNRLLQGLLQSVQYYQVSLLLACLILIVGGVSVWWLGSVDTPKSLPPEIVPSPVTPVDVTEPGVTEPDVTEPDVTEPDVTEPDVTEPDVIGKETDQSFLWWWLLPLTGLVLSLYAWWRRGLLERVPEVRVTLDQPSSATPAEALLTTNHEPDERQSFWLDNDTLDYCADSVGSFLSEVSDTTLDIEATVTATINAAGCPVVRLQQRRELFHLLILVDLDNEAVYWNALPQALASGLRARGLPVSLGHFQGRLQQVVLDSGKVTTLTELGEDREQYCALLFADAALLAADSHHVELTELAGWPQFVWLAFREQRHWSGAEQALLRRGIALWEAKAACLPAVFRYLAGEVLHTRSMALPHWPFQEQQLHHNEQLTDYLPRFLGEVLPLARIVALLPPPVSPALVVRITQTFTPHLSLFRLQRLFNLPGEVQSVGGVYWPVPVLKQLRSEFHRLLSEAEKEQICTTLLNWLAEDEPADKNSTDWLEWRFRYARLLGEHDADTAWVMMAELEQKGLPKARFIGLSEDVLPMPEPTCAQSLKTAYQFGRRYNMPTVDVQQAFPEWIFWRRLVPLGAVLTVILCCVALYPTLQILFPLELYSIAQNEPVQPETSTQTTKPAEVMLFPPESDNMV